MSPLGDLPMLSHKGLVSLVVIEKINEKKVLKLKKKHEKYNNNPVICT